MLGMNDRQEPVFSATMEEARELLRKYYGYLDFREGQKKK